MASWTRSTRAAPGSATTRCSPRFCARSCGIVSRTSSRLCTARRASWFARHGQPLEAVRHAVAGSNWQLAAEVVGAQWLVCVVHGSGAVLRELASEIPAEVVNGDAELALAMAGLLLEAGEIEEADELLLRAYELADELHRAGVAASRSPRRPPRPTALASRGTSARRSAPRGSRSTSAGTARSRSRCARSRWPTSESRSSGPTSSRRRSSTSRRRPGSRFEFENDFVLFIAKSYLAAVDARQGRLADAHSRARTAIQLAERRGWTEVPTPPSRTRRWRWCTSGGTSSTKPSAPVIWRATPSGAAASPCSPRWSRRSGRAIQGLRGDPVTALEILRGGETDDKLPPWLRVSAAMIEAELWMALGEPARARTALTTVSSSELSDYAIGWRGWSWRSGSRTRRCGRSPGSSRTSARR